MNKKLKKKSGKIPREAKPDYNSLTPKFSLEFFRKPYCFSELDKDLKCAFADKLFKLSKQKWQDISKLGINQGGFEIKPQTIIKNIPEEFSDKTILASKFGAKVRMYCFRENDICYIFDVDTKFNMYDHGS